MNYLRQPRIWRSLNKGASSGRWGSWVVRAVESITDLCLVKHSVNSSGFKESGKGFYCRQDRQANKERIVSASAEAFIT